jgi:MFS family permease
MSNIARQLRVLRHRDFRYLWLAQSSSVIGDCIVIVALALFVIDLTGSATDLGLVLGASSLPLAAFLLLGGVWADRLPRHRMMVVTDLVRFTLHALLAALIFTGAVRIWQLIAIEALFGTAEAFFRPAANGLLPQTVPEEEIQQANALSSLSNNIGEFAGPALATALVLGLGAGCAFALDAATFLLSAALLSRVRPRRRAVAPSPSTEQAPGLPPEEAPAAAGVWADIRDGFREVRSRDWVWATLAAFCVALFTGLAPWFVRRLADRDRLAPALPDARRDARDHPLAGRDGALRARRDALHRRPRDVDRRRRDRAVRRLVDDGARRADPRRQALARQLL